MAVESHPTKAELRASVLDAALNLGIRNSVVARWVFDPITEAEDTDYDESNPGLTTSPSSSNTSRSSHADSVTPLDEYAFAPPHHPLITVPMPLIVNDARVAIMGPDEASHWRSEEIRPLAAAELDLANNYRVANEGERTFQTHFLGDTERERPDGGYLSDVAGKKTPKQKGTLFKKRRNKAAGDGYESDGNIMLEASKSSKKDKKKKSSGKRANEDPGFVQNSLNTIPPLPALDDLSLSRSLSPAVHHTAETQADGAAILNAATPLKNKSEQNQKERERGREKVNSDPPETPSKKRGIFRLMTSGREKSKERKEKDREEAPEPLPPMPKIPLPIAERFARASGESTALTSSGRSTPSDHTTSNAPTATSSNALADVIKLEPQSQARRVGAAKGEQSAFWGSRLDTVIPRGSLEGAGQPSSGANSRSASLDVHDKPDVFHSKPRSTSPPPIVRSLSPPPIVSRKGASSPAMSPARKMGLFSKRKGSGTSVSSEDESSQDGHASQSKPSKIGLISAPNPHLNVPGAAAPPSPLALAAALTSRNGRSPSKDSNTENESGEVAPWNKTRGVNTAVEHKIREPSKPLVRESALSIVVPSSVYIVPSPQPSPMPSQNQSGGTNLLAPPVPAFMYSPRSPGSTMRQQRATEASTSTTIALPTTPTRASVLAYYDVPPPSPPPTTPLPKVPATLEGQSTTRSRAEHRGEQINRFLSPNPSGRPMSRSPSPLRSGLRSNQSSPGLPASPLPSPSPSPIPAGSFDQPIPYTKRGKQSPFPARPILPKEDNPTLKSLVSRRPTLTIRSRTQSYRNGSSLGEEVYDDGEEGDPIEPLDTEEEEVRLERERARARGEKRVGFSDAAYAEDEEEEDAYAGIAEDLKLEPSQSDAARPPLEPSRSSSGVDEFFGTEGGADDDDDRSVYTDADGQSMHSRYSVVEPERSAAIRERFMKRVESFYNKSEGEGGFSGEVIPEVPALPKSLRDAAAASASSALSERKGIIKNSADYF